MNKKDEEIQQKLEELENTILKETASVNPNLPAVHGAPLLPGTRDDGVVSTAEAPTVTSDLCYFGGIGSILVGLYLMFQHIRVGTGMMAMFGMSGGGFGLILLPLMVGIGWLIYDSKSKIAWMLTAGTCAAIVLYVLCSLVMVFPMLSLMQMIMILVPFALGGALLLKGIGGPKAVEAKLKKLKS